LDFNMARDPDAVAHVEDRIRGGTLPYMAPEQLGAFLDSSLWSEIGPQSDIYSLGLVIKELATGQRSEVPFAANCVLMDQIRILLKQRDQDWKSIRDSKAGISGALDAILEKSLQFRPVDRYRNAHELAEDYERLLHGKPLKWAVNRSLSERIASGLRPIRYYFVLLLLVFIGWSIWPKADEISVSGLTPLESRLMRDHQFADALAVFRRTSSDQDESTVRDLLYFVSWVETEPDNPLAEEEMKALISRTDLDSALVQANGLIGSNRHLDFIPLYRDFCQVSMIYQKSPELISGLEWQNLERRFSELQKKWPEDIRLAGFLSYFASMRSDYLTGSKQARNGIEIAERSSHPLDEEVIRDLRKREIQYHQLYAATLQTEDRPVEARKYYLETLDKIQQMRGMYHQMADKVLMAFLAEIEIIVSIGIGDVLADLNQLKEANSQFVESKKLLNRYDDSLLDSQLAASLIDSLNLRLNALSDYEIGTSAIRPKNQKE
ncbi:MAG: Serine/threonine-protein kinase StkP, partial [Planctomycetota bacterium]